MASFKLVICDVRSSMFSSDALKRKLIEKLPSLDIRDVSYDETRQCSIYIDYFPEEHALQIIGSNIQHTEGVDAISYAKSIQHSPHYSHEFIIEWIKDIRSNHKQTESYNVF